MSEIVYRVKDWDIHFENNKSREREQCSFVCVPNKQHGMGFSRVMAEKDGATIYGIWHLILGACSQQKRTEIGGRSGWLTHDGHQTGTAWAPDDLAVKFRRPEPEIARAIAVLTSDKVGWLETYEVVDSKLVPTSARQVPAKCPPDALEEKRREMNRREEKEKNVSGLKNRISKWFNRRESTIWSDKEERGLKKVIASDTPEDELTLLEKYYTAEINQNSDYRRKNIETLLNNWAGEIDRARKFTTQSNGPDYSEENPFLIEN